jgi:hypothetical protein
VQVNNAVDAVEEHRRRRQHERDCTGDGNRAWKPAACATLVCATEAGTRDRAGSMQHEERELPARQVAAAKPIDFAVWRSTPRQNPLPPFKDLRRSAPLTVRRA